MARFSNYDLDLTVSELDFLIGLDQDDLDTPRRYNIADLLDLLVARGIQGPVGPSGRDGARGFTGAQGEQGDMGISIIRITDARNPADDGTTITVSLSNGTIEVFNIPDGDQGPQGIQGETGPQGLTGDTGADSMVPGPQGIQGEQGIQGDTGLTGADSMVPGPQGIQGPAGQDGTDGVDGTIGPMGLPGDQGVMGEQGDMGDAGVDGESVNFGTADGGIISIIRTGTATTPTAYDAATMTLTLGGADASGDQLDLLIFNPFTPDPPASMTVDGEIFTTTSTEGPDVEFLTEITFQRQQRITEEYTQTRTTRIEVRGIPDDPEPMADPSQLTRTIPREVVDLPDREISRRNDVPNPLFVPSMMLRTFKSGLAPFPTVGELTQATIDGFTDSGITRPSGIIAGTFGMFEFTSYVYFVYDASLTLNSIRAGSVNIPLETQQTITLGDNRYNVRRGTATVLDSGTGGIDYSDIIIS